MNRKYLIIGSLLFLLIIASYLILLTLKPEIVFFLGKEDGIVEICSSSCYLISACLFFYLFFNSKSHNQKYLLNTDRNYFFLLLGLLFFFCFGEEISWGQRILDLKTPDWLEKSNAQQEINLHNLYIFQPADTPDQQQKVLGIWLNAGRIYTLFWLLYCVFIPFLNKFFSYLQTLFKKISLPVVPLWIAILFLLNFILQNVIEVIYSPNFPPRFSEFYENNTAVLFLAVSLYFLKIYGRPANHQ